MGDIKVVLGTDLYVEKASLFLLPATMLRPFKHHLVRELGHCVDGRCPSLTSCAPLGLMAQSPEWGVR